MNVQNYSKKIKRVKRAYLVYLVCINLFIIPFILLVLATSKKEVDVIKISIFACLTWLPLNVIFAILYLRVGNAKSLNSIKSFDNISKSDRKTLIKAAVLLYIPIALGVMVLIKGAVLIGCGIICVSCLAYIYYQQKLLRKSKKKEQEHTLISD